MVLWYLLRKIPACKRTFENMKYSSARNYRIEDNYIAMREVEVILNSFRRALEQLELIRFVV